jgi:hypothetical protein
MLRHRIKNNELKKIEYVIVHMELKSVEDVRVVQ